MASDVQWWTYSARGRRRDMQDEHVIARCEQTGWCLFAVMDGHGGTGAVTALKHWVGPEICAALRSATLEKNTARFSDVDIARRLQTAVANLDTRLYAELTHANRNSGTTLILAAYHPRTRQLFIANVGDSRAVLADVRTGQTLMYTRDHTAKDPTEIRRIYAAGGHVANHRVAGILAPSRALGDFAVGLKRPFPPAPE